MARPTPVSAIGDVTTHQFDTSYRQSLIVTFAIAGTLVVYALLVEGLRRSLPAAPSIEGLDMIRLAFYATSGVFVFTTTVLRGVMLRRAPASADLRLARLRTASILTAAFAETPVLLGLVLFFLGRMTTDFYLLFVVSLYMIARHFPRRGAWEAYVRGTAARPAR